MSISKTKKAKNIRKSYSESYSEKLHSDIT